MVRRLPVLLVCVVLLATGSFAEEAEVIQTCNPSWFPLPGSLIHITASMNYLWGVNRAYQIFVCNIPCTGNWQQISGQLKQIDADDSEVWGVNQNDFIYKRPVDGSSSWIKVSGGLKHVSASGNGYIWGVNSIDDIYKCKKPCSGGWQKVEGKLSQIDGGNQYVYGVTSGKTPFFRPVDGSGTWQSIENNTTANYITATGDNKVYKLGMYNKVYSCDAPCSDGEWTRLSDDTLTQIDGSVHFLVGRNAAEQLFYKNV